MRTNPRPAAETGARVTRTTHRVHPAFDPHSAVRRCARPDCSSTAAVTLVCDYTARTVVMTPASAVLEVDDPARYDLCGRHADRFRPPHGWELTLDAREQSSPVPELVPEPATEPAPAAGRLTWDDLRGADLSAMDPRDLADALG